MVRTLNQNNGNQTQSANNANTNQQAKGFSLMLDGKYLGYVMLSKNIPAEVQAQIDAEVLSGMLKGVEVEAFKEKEETTFDVSKYKSA